MKATALLLCLAVAFFEFQEVLSEENKQPLAKTLNGPILGTTLTSRLGKVIYAFRGIRYAAAPVQDLRFKPPQPAKNWEGTYNATKDGAACPQSNSVPNDEDCLFLNVYTTKIPKKGEDNPKRPVIVFIHPGNFYNLTGGSKWAGPQYLLDQEIVLVTFNYRLGPLGFISTGDKEAPGNLGLKDQVQALKWVKEHILYFGGSPELVTIYGYGSGSVSVMLHMISPLSKGLFHRAIASSGSALGTWPTKSHQLDLAKQLAKLVECQDDTPANIISCLKKKPAETLMKSLSSFKEFGDDPLVIWQPVIESDFGQERFLTDNPVKLVMTNKFEKVPLLTGITTDEYGCKAFEVVRNATLLQKLDKEFEVYAPIAFCYEKNTDKSKEISKEIRKAYFADKPLDNSSLPGLAQLYSDALVGFGVNRAAKLFSDHNTDPVFYYRFNYKGRYSHYYLSDTNNTVPYGVVDKDDLIYLFHISTRFPMFKEADPESQMVDKMTTMWANFAKTGNPIPEPTDKLDKVNWEPFTRHTNKYMDMGNKLGMKANLFDKRYEVWDKVIPLPQPVHVG